ncbi:DUF1315 family protein [Parashewanella curva]|uniref:DUF1315 family protein n=1 Tax=Parashewanella curva TaxID=2338552 RepID=A0A3L8PWH3_9GAMM|nr:DUF1315 family protein [Parashewanella curva]RLV59641.1 DUF1315 family protein [Parashewanella curva]
MDLHKIIDDMPEEVYQRMRSAMELGKWENGVALTEEQREHALQVVMLYQARHLEQTDHFTIGSEGQINELSKSELKKQFKGDTIAEFKQDEF